MKRMYLCAAMLLAAACDRSGDYDAAGTFEATEITVSAEAAGRILSFDVQEGDLLEAGRPVGVIDTVQLRLQKLCLERQRASVRSGRPDISKQVAALREQIAKQRTERRRAENLLRDGAATAKQLDDIDAQLRVLGGQLDAALSTLRNNAAAVDENASAIDLQIAQIDDRLAKCRIASPVTGTVLAKYAEAGELASVGRPLMKVADLSRVYLRAYCTRPRGVRNGRFRRCGAIRVRGPRRLDRFRERIYAQDYPDARFAGQSGVCRQNRRRERRTSQTRFVWNGPTVRLRFRG